MGGFPLGRGLRKRFGEGEMPQEFDPYHRWLGIPPEEQPADHYRLLGLVRFEDDIEVIRDAAERQIGHVRRYGLGKHSELSQRILNELAAAKACLMDPDDKPGYDARLRKKIQTATPPPAAESASAAPSSLPTEPPLPPPNQPPHVRTTPPAVESDKKQTRTRRRARGRRAKWLIGAGGLVLVGMAAWAVIPRWQGGDQAPPVAEGSAADPSATPPSEQQQSSRPPRLARIPDQNAVEGKALEVRAEVADPGSDPGPLLFSLVFPPAGARIDAASGVLTWTPARDQAGKKHAVTVEVAPRDARDLADRISFAVAVREGSRHPEIRAIPEQRLDAGTRREIQVSAIDSKRQTSGGWPSATPAADLSGLLEIKGPSGSLNPSQMDLYETANSAALNLTNRLVRGDPKVASLLAGAAVAELNKSNKLDGVVVEFQPGKDPVTCARAAAARPRMFLGQTAQTGWEEVRLRAYLEFTQGARHGKVAAWDAGGQRAFWGNCQRGNRDGFCCLFENNRPRIVVVFDDGKKGAAYLIANNRVEKSFAGEEEAQRDAAAPPLLAKLDEIELQFKEGERALEGEINKSIRRKLGDRNRANREMEQMRRLLRENRQKSGVQDLKRKGGF